MSPMYWKGDSLCHVQSCLQQHGLSTLLLQSCLSGYYRVDGILFGGICQPCECHGHAVECSIHGECFVSHTETLSAPSYLSQSHLLCRADLKKKNDSSQENILAPADPKGNLQI